MPTLVNGETLYDTISIAQQTGTKILLDTDGKYVQKDISLTLNVQGASPSFDGGTLSNKGATATFSNMTTSVTNTSGIAIQAHGFAVRDAVLYNGIVNGWVSVSDNTIALRAANSSSWDGTTYYVTGVTLENGKTFNITVPNGSNGTITFHFAVDANGNTTIT